MDNFLIPFWRQPNSSEYDVNKRSVAQSSTIVISRTKIPFFRITQVSQLSTKEVGLRLEAVLAS